MPTLNAIVTPQPECNDVPNGPAIVAPTKQEEAEAAFAPESDDRWAHMPCTD